MYIKPYCYQGINYIDRTLIAYGLPMPMPWDEAGPMPLPINFLMNMYDFEYWIFSLLC